VALLYLASVCAVLLFGYAGSHNRSVSSQATWALWCMNVYAWLLIGMLLTKASIIWELRERYTRGWRNSFAFVVYLTVLTLGAAFVIHAYASNEASPHHFPSADVIGQFWDGALALTLLDLVVGLFLVPLARPVAYLLGVPLDKPVKVTLLWRGREEAKRKSEPGQTD
jgi:hypothetical protein